ncbi:MAG: TetR family transcriptional regulator C-terminal domain-containing protein [Pseudonocardia sediminis]
MQADRIAKGESVPRIVDHGQRRGEIAEALWRIAAREGLETVSLSRVADEAGVSKGRVQHYFGSREELLGFTATLLQQRVDGRVQAQLAQVTTGEPLDFVRALLAGMLPLDDESRTDALVGSAFFVRAVADPQLRETYRGGNRLMRDVLAEKLAHARDAGRIAADVDPSHESTVLFALAGGLGESILVGDHTPGSALAVVDRQLERLSG